LRRIRIVADIDQIIRYFSIFPCKIIDFFAQILQYCQCSPRSHGNNFQEVASQIKYAPVARSCDWR